MSNEAQAETQPQSRSRAIPIAIAVVGVLSAGLVWQISNSGATGEKVPATVGYLAPDFALESSDGGKWKLSDHRGKRVLLVFFRTHT
jgi:cytochrome oxidase Cu insertion factor (SCO1/SenC/PrrC family)